MLYVQQGGDGYDSDVSSQCVEQVESSSEESASENELSNSTKSIEATLSKLHEVPDGDHETAANSIDEDIETRLLQLSLQMFQKMSLQIPLMMRLRRGC